jgi:hypothetical protein
MAHPEEHIDVAVHTTAGRFPATGYDSTPIHQKIRIMLERAATALKITNIDQWVARADGKELDPNTTYLESNLHGQIVIDFGPRESGGG